MRQNVGVLQHTEVHWLNYIFIKLISTENLPVCGITGDEDIELGAEEEGENSPLLCVTIRYFKINFELKYREN